MMKKCLYAAAAALMMSIAACGCGQSGTSEPAQSTTAAVTEAPSAAATTAAAIGGLQANGLIAENFGEENGWKTYSENGAVVSTVGVDVSSYCSDIDWERVRDAGVTFVMVRLGGRGYGDNGALYADDRAAEYIAGAQAAGLKTGGYFFSQAITPEEAREEAAYCRELLGGLTLDYPIAYDWEFIKDDTARTDGLTVEQTTACAKAFCDEVKTYGWTPMLYAGDAEMTAKYDLNQLADVEIWYCEYADYPAFPYQIGMWQYSKTGTVDGIETDADLNIRFLNGATGQ